MNTAEGKRQVFLGVVIASILLTGFVLALVMSVVALCFLMAGYALSVEVMGVVWISALAVWLAGSLPVAKYIDVGLFIFGFIIFVGTGVWLLVSTVTAPIYGTIGLPFILAFLMYGTFLSLILKFSGLIPEEDAPEMSETK